MALTLLGLGGLPSEHFLCLQMLGMHGTIYANYAVNEADLLLALGVRFDDRVTGKVSEFAKHGKIVHIDIDASELNKNKPALLPIHGDVRQALHDLLNLMDDQEAELVVQKPQHVEWIRQIEDWRESEPIRFNDRDDAILPQYAIGRLWQILQDRGQLDDTIITTGVGQHQMWAAQYFHFNSPRHWITSGGLGAMGFGLPSALGAQAANPDKLVIDIDGDGSFVMNIQELACAFARNCLSRCCSSTINIWAWSCSGKIAFFKAIEPIPILEPGKMKPPIPTLSPWPKASVVAPIASLRKKTLMRPSKK